jgi:hypothetical protein
MGYESKRVWGVAAGAFALGIIGVSIAAADLVSGGGPKKSDCYAEWDMNGVTAANVKGNKKVTCQDGAACDAGPKGDGACVFEAKQCWNQQNEPSCTPPTSLDSINIKGPGVNTDLAGLEGSSCAGAFLEIPVATKANGKKAGKANYRVLAKAPKGSKPRTDVDTYQLICEPGPASASGAFLD